MVLYIARTFLTPLRLPSEKHDGTTCCAAKLRKIGLIRKLGYFCEIVYIDLKRGRIGDGERVRLYKLLQLNAGYTKDQY
jgi:hypothetical protein